MAPRSISSTSTSEPLSGNGLCHLRARSCRPCSFSLHRRFSWFLAWWVGFFFFLCKPGQFGYDVLRVWILFKSLSQRPWHIAGVLTHYCQGEASVQMAHVPSCDTCCAIPGVFTVSARRPPSLYFSECSYVSCLYRVGVSAVIYGVRRETYVYFLLAPNWTSEMQLIFVYWWCFRWRGINPFQTRVIE